jgi:hypothetical protein
LSTALALVIVVRRESGDSVEMDERLVRRQSGVLTRRQCAEAGVSRWHIRNQLAARRWQLFGRVVVLHNGPITRTQQLWVAVLNHRVPSALAGLTACEWLGLKGFESPTIHVMSPFGARPLRLPGVTTHVTRDYSSVLANDVPCAWPARAVVQSASWEPVKRRACAIAVAAVQQRIVTVGRLTAELADFHGRHSALLRGVAGDIRGGADSLAEIDFVRLARAAGIPPPVQQAVRLDTFGRRRYLDADFGCFAVEVDGGFHRTASNYSADMERLNDLVIGGDRVLRFSSFVIRADPEAVIKQLRLAWAAFGPKA